MLSKVNSGAMNASDEEGKESEPYHIIASLADSSETAHPYANETFVVSISVGCTVDALFKATKSNLVCFPTEMVERGSESTDSRCNTMLHIVYCIKHTD